MESAKQVEAKSSRFPKGLIIGCLVSGALVTIGVILGVLVWLITSPEGGVRLSNQVEQYAVEYIQEHQLLEADETILAYYDITISLNGSEAAILTDKRILYHSKGGSTSIGLTEIADVQHRYDKFIGDIIVVTADSGQAMKIVIAPANNGSLFHTSLINAWQAARESLGQE